MEKPLSQIIILCIYLGSTICTNKEKASTLEVLAFYYL